MSSPFTFCLNIAVLSFSFLVSCDCLTLDEYCFLQLPPTKRIFKSRMGYLPLVNMCSNIDAYTECLLFTRVWDVPGIEVEPFEKDFPAESDMYIAGYIFCGEELYIRFATYMKNEDDIAVCEKNINYKTCQRYIKEILDQHSVNVGINSCKLTIMYYRCLRNLYKACNRDYEIFFTYFIARVGTACLISQNEYNSLILNNVCPQQHAAQYISEGTVKRSIMWSITTGMVCVMKALAMLH